MAKNEVSVTLKAYDQTAAAFKSAEKSMDRLVRGAKAFAGGVGLALGAAGLGRFFKGAAEAAAKHSPEIRARMETLTASFENMQAKIGQAIFANDSGFAFAMQKLAEASATHIPTFIGWIGKGYEKLNAFYEATMRAAFAINRLLGGKGDPRGEFWDVSSGATSYSVPKPPAGTKQGRRPLDTSNPLLSGDIYGSLFGTATSVRDPFLDRMLDPLGRTDLVGMPDPGQIADQLDQLTPRIPEFLQQMQFFDELKAQFTDRIAGSIGEAFAAGIEQAIASGSIADGFKALSGTLLAGIGSAMIEFGTASLAAAIKMQLIKAGLGSFNPGVAIGASLGMIAIGSTLKGVASRAFGSMGAANRAVSSSLSGSAELTRSEPLVVYLPHGAYAKADSPEFQEFIAEVLAKGAGRGIVFRPA